MLIIKYHYDVNNAQLDRSRFTFIVILGAAAAARPGLTLLLSFFFYSFFFFSIFLYYIYFFLPTILIPSLTFSSLRSVCVCLLSVVYSPLPSTRWRPSSPGEREKKKKGKTTQDASKSIELKLVIFRRHTQHEKWKEKKKDWEKYKE